MVAERAGSATKVEKWYEEESAVLHDFIRESAKHLLNGVKYEKRRYTDLVSHDFNLRLDPSELLIAPKSIRRLIGVAGIDIYKHSSVYEKADPVEAKLNLLICTRDQSQQFSIEVKKMSSDSGIDLSILTIGSHDDFDPLLAKAAVEGAEWLKRVIKARRVKGSD